MVTVSLGLRDLRALTGERSDERLLEAMPLLGGSVEERDGDAVVMEYFPDRPDLVSVEGIARALRAFLGHEGGLTTYPAAKGAATCTVEPSVRKVRPHIVMAYVRGVPVDEEELVRLIDIQEKLHTGVGKRRRRVAIGVHDAGKVSPPFRYWGAVPDEASFVPLQDTRRMSLREILEKLDKGREYAHLLAGADRYPLITDKGGDVLSFPPIINGRLTTVTTDTRDLLLDATGLDPDAVSTCMAILVTSLAERGGRIESVSIKTRGKTLVTPDLSPRRGALRLSEVERLLGVKVSATEAAKHLRRMGHDAKPAGSGKLAVLSPRWRPDLMHPVDLVEDVAKAMGYMRFEPTLPRAATFGAPLPRLRREHAARLSLAGLGFLEVTTLTLSNPGDQFQRMGLEPRPVVEVTNPISVEHTCLRVSLLPSLLRLLAANKGRDLPQALFEVGDVVEADRGPPRNLRRVAAVKAASKATFTECKSLVEAFLRRMGVAATVRAASHGAFVPGRCAEAVAAGMALGTFGEVHPRTLQAFEYENPVLALEFSL